MTLREYVPWGIALAVVVATAIGVALLHEDTRAQERIVIAEDKILAVSKDVEPLSWKVRVVQGRKYLVWIYRTGRGSSTVVDMEVIDLGPAKE